MEALKTLREAKGLTQAELAQKANLSKNTIWNYENGHRSPKIIDLKTIAQALDCNVNELLIPEEEN